MNNLFKLIQRYYFTLLFVLLFVASVLLYVRTTYYQKAALGGITREITGYFSSKIADVKEYFSLKDNNIRLSMENVALRNSLERYRAILQAVSDSSLVRVDSSVSFRYIPARIVRNSVNLLNNFMVIDVGTKQGVTKGMGVVCVNGVVGVVIAASPHFSSVISLLNTNLKVSAKHSKSGVFGSLSWNGIDYRQVELLEIPLHIDIAVGDTILTSGFSTLFPRNIPIGAITDFEKKGGRFYDIRVGLFADFKGLDRVYVLQSLKHEEFVRIENSY